MQKKDVLKLINFDGNYNDEVKKELKTLLKKYHPDNIKSGDQEIFKIIKETKEELEKINNSKETKNKNTKENISTINRVDYLNKIIKLSNEREIKYKKINKNYEVISELYNEYGNLYDKYIDTQNKICYIEDTLLKYNYIKRILIIILLIILSLMSLCLIKYNKYIILILIINIVIEILLYTFYKEKTKCSKEESNYILENLNTNKELRIYADKLKTLSQLNYDEKLELTKIENDIRFYNNELNKE